MLHLSPAQAWLNRRLLGQTAESFGGSKDIRFYSTGNLSPPPGFEHAWHMWHAETQQGFSDDLDMTEVAGIVIFGNTSVESQRKKLLQLFRAVEKQVHSVPPLVWVHHTVAPDSWYQGRKMIQLPPSSTTFDCVSEILHGGIDDIILKEHEGAVLSLAVQKHLKMFTVKTTRLFEVVEARRIKATYAAFLEDCIHKMLWEYARSKIAPCIPPVNLRIPAHFTRLGDYIVGKELGRGMFGCVYKLHLKDKQDEKELEPVVKVVSKAGVKDVNDLRNMRQTVNVMMLLSKPEHAHANIVQLFEIYHSVESIIFVMEDGGPENLYQRLSYRNHKDDMKRRPMSLRAVESLILQTLIAIQHLHSNVGVCHRDIKPENFVVLHTASDDHLILKLTDFDLSVPYQKHNMCRTTCGTMPFVAPEVILAREYDGLLCDVWSLAVVLLEVLCGVGVLEKVLKLQNLGKGGATPSKTIASKIAQWFAAPQSASQLVKMAHMPEYEPLVNTMQVLVDGMLSVDVKCRWSAEQSFAHFTAESQKPCESEH